MINRTIALVVTAGLAITAPAGAEHPGALVASDAQVDSIFRISLLTGRIVLRFDAPTSLPVGIVYDGTSLWLVDGASGSRQVVQLHPETGEILGAFPWVGTGPTGIAWDGSTLWVVDAGRDSFYTMDRSTGERTTRFRVPWSQGLNPNPTGLVYDGSSLWAVDSQSDRAYKIAPATGDSTFSFPVPTGPSGANPWGLAWDGNALWLSDVEVDRIYQLDPTTGAVLGSLPSPGGSVRGLAYLPGSTRVEATSWGRVKRLYRF